jgi:hypothetical protein
MLAVIEVFIVHFISRLKAAPTTLIPAILCVLQEDALPGRAIKLGLKSVFNLRKTDN